MNTTDLKLDIKRQVDELDENLLNDLAVFLRNRVKLFNESVLEGLSDSQLEAITQAQDSIKQGLGISHAEVVSKFKTKYGSNSPLIWSPEVVCDLKKGLEYLE